MALHLELHAESLERQGLSRSEVRRRVRAEFGGVQQYREEGREARALSWMHDLIADLRYGLHAATLARLRESILSRRCVPTESARRAPAYADWLPKNFVANRRCFAQLPLV